MPLGRRARRPMADETKPVTTHELLAMKERGERIVVLTCYDALFARLLDASGVDVLLVGDSVNLEGGTPMADTVRALVDVGIPVMGHLGLTPQSVHALGGYRVQGRDERTAERLKADAKALEQAGAFSIVLELIPAPLASQMSKSLTIPTIGIGAGPACDGQVLVLPDMLGLNDRFSAKFVKRYAALAEDVREAVKLYAAEVREGRYPGPEHSFPK